MGLKEFDTTTYTVEYIPQKLATLDLCIIACHTLLSRAGSTPIKLDFGSSTLDLPNLNVLLDVSIEAGLVANRTLLNFLGLKLDNGALINENYALTIDEFSLPLVTVSDACKILEPNIPSLEMKRIWVEALNTASKASAHFTKKGSTISVARLGFACFATSKLVRDRFFLATSTLPPESIVKAEVAPQFGTVWDSVDPGTTLLR